MEYGEILDPVICSIPERRLHLILTKGFHSECVNVNCGSRHDDILEITSVPVSDAQKYPSDINETDHVLEWILALLKHRVSPELFDACTHNANVNLIFWNDMRYLHVLEGKKHPDTLDLNMNNVEELVERYKLRRNMKTDDIKIYDIKTSEQKSRPAVTFSERGWQ